MSKLHPLVKAFCETGRQLSWVVEQVPCPGDSTVETIRQLLGAVKGEFSREEGLRIARSVSLDRIDPNLAIMILALWAHLLDWRNRAVEMHALFKRALDFRGPETPYEVWRIISYLDIHSVYRSGNKRRAEEMFSQSLDTMPLTSAHRAFALTEYATLLANKGRATELEVELTKAEAERGDLSPLFNGIRLIQSVETCRMDEALRLLPEMEKVSAFNATNAERMEIARALIALVRGGPAAPSQDRPEITLLKMLLSRRPEEGLALVIGQPVDSLEVYHTDCVFCAFNLIRAELACGHGEAARRLLRIRRDIGNEHPFDPFFLARVEMLAGNREAAARHFALALRNAEKYRAEPRLDFELKLSCELPPGELMRLVRAADRLPAKSVGELPAPAVRAEEATGTARLVGDSQPMERTRRAVLQYAPLDVPVLITGETGTGKELVARAIHEAGPRASGSFLAVNCGAITESLLESELFGHERGAFTGAARTRKGLFEEAGGGTILLDEIGEISPRLQVALLRVLETGEVRPVGSNRSRKIRCRIIAATNADLADLAAKGAFRQDLLFRLQRLEIFIPPLRKRREDILPLTDYFLCLGRSDSRRPVLSDGFKTRLLAQPWPGNARELRNLIEKLRLLNSDKLSYEELDLEAILSLTTTPAGSPPGPQENVAAGVRDATFETSSASAPASESAPFTGRTALRRRERLRELFRQHKNLTRQEITRLLGISGPTATEDLKALLADGCIERVAPNASPRTHYFRLRR